MDIRDSIAPRSDQQNFDDYTLGPKTVTISEVRAGTTEQPIEIHLLEHPGKPYKPSRSMRRVVVAAWGPDASVYTGRRLTIYGDPTVRFGPDVVGGLKISHLSHIDKPLDVSLTVTRGKRKPYRVEPLIERDWTTELTHAGNNLDAVYALGKAARAAGATETTIAAITARYNELKPAKDAERPTDGD